jgi:hypothetical protein
MKKLDEHKRETPNPGADAEPLEELFRSAHRDGFTPRETEEIWNRLHVVLGAPPGRGGSSSSSGGSASGAAGSALGVKTAVVLLLGGSIVAAGAFSIVRTSGSTSHRTAPPASLATPLERPESDPRPRGRVESPAFEGPAIEPPNARPGLGPESPSSSLPQEPRGPSSPRAAATSHPPAPPRRPAAPATRPLESANAADFDAVGQNAAAVEPTPSATSQPRPSDPGPSEGALLLRARRELASDPSSALKLTEEHGKLFPTGTLAPEREVLAVEALAELGRLAEARARLADFRSRFPQSPHLARLDALLGR